MFNRKFGLVYSHKKGLPHIKCTWPKKYSETEMLVFAKMLSQWSNPLYQDLLKEAILKSGRRYKDEDFAIDLCFRLENYWNDGEKKNLPDPIPDIWDGSKPAIPPLSFANFHGGARGE